MPPAEQIGQIIETKKTIDRLIHDRHHQLAQSYGLSLEQFNLLIELDELMLDLPADAAAPTVGALAKNINNTQNTVSEKIGRLEKKGLVARVRDELDKRISRVVLTDQGRKLIVAIEKEAEGSFLADALARMTEPEIASLARGLRQLLLALEPPLGEERSPR